MGVWMGVNAEATINTGLTGLYVHNARLEWQEPEFDVTGSGHKNQVTARGDRQIRVRLVCSHNGATPSAILPGAAANLTLKIDTTTGASYTDDYVVQASPWEQEHRGGGPPQVFTIILTPHDENASNQTVTTGIWA